jgi:hypothetical protein
MKVIAKRINLQPSQIPAPEERFRPVILQEENAFHEIWSDKPSPNGDWFLVSKSSGQVYSGHYEWIKSIFMFSSFKNEEVTKFERTENPLWKWRNPGGNEKMIKVERLRINDREVFVRLDYRVFFIEKLGHIDF